MSAGHYLWTARISGSGIWAFSILCLSCCFTKFAFISISWFLDLNQNLVNCSLWEVKDVPLRLSPVSCYTWYCARVWTVALFFPLLQVNLEGKANPLSLLQMASPSGFCVLVRLPKLICGGKTLPKTLLNILADGTILKVGVGCSEDASRLLQDYGLFVKGCLDLRYLAMRQRYGLYQCC